MGQGTVTRAKCGICGKPFNQCKYKGKHPSSTPNINSEAFLSDYNQAEVGDYFYSDGTFSHQKQNSKTAVGIVFSTKTSSYDQSHGFFHGYIMALKDAKKGRCGWEPSNIDCQNIPNLDYRDGKQMLEDYNGYKYSLDALSYSSNASAFSYAKNAIPKIHDKRVSDWYVPSIGQWMLIVKNLGKTNPYIHDVGVITKLNFDAKQAKNNPLVIGLSFFI